MIISHHTYKFFAARDSRVDVWLDCIPATNNIKMNLNADPKSINFSLVFLVARSNTPYWPNWLTGGRLDLIDCR
jgi:hypothetical protein